MYNLILTVTKSPIDTLLKTSYRFDQRSGTIGRGANNDWTLNDPECILSGKHLEIIYENESYLAKDTSSNGSFLHPSSEELDRVKGTIIQNNQVIEIGDFLLHAQLEQIMVSEPQTVNLSDPEISQQDSVEKTITSPQKLSPFDITNDTQEVTNNSPFAEHNSFDGTQEVVSPKQPQELPTSEVMSSGIGSSSKSQEISSTIGKTIVAKENGFTEQHSQSILGHNAPSLNASRLQPESNNTSASNGGLSPLSKVPEDWDEEPEVSPPTTSSPSSTTENLNELSNESVTSHSTVSSESALENSIQKPLGAPDELLDTLSGIANDQVSSQINNLENTNLKNTGDVTEDVTNTGIKTPRPKPRPAIAQPEQTSSASYNGNEYQHFLQTLGLSNTADASHSPDLFAQIFSLVTEQLINILRSRNKLRQQFRLAVTSIQKTDNNPLTFSVNTDDAIHNLFVKKNAGYLPAMDSYEQAFSTIEHHQLAVIVGMRAGFENMLSAFSPESLTGLKPSEKDKKSWGLFSSDKNSFEENYDAHYQQLLKNKEQTFIQLFGEAFTHAYELSVHQQKSEEKLKQENR